MAASEPPAGGPGPGPRNPLPSTLARRVEEIVDAAQRQAEVIERDLEAHRLAAEAEVESYLEEGRRQADALVEGRVQRMRELTDELVERAEATRQHFDGLIAALERVTARLERESGPPPLPDQRREPPRSRSPERPSAAGDLGAPAALRGAIRRPDEVIRPSSAAAASRRAPRPAAAPGGARSQPRRPPPPARPGPPSLGQGPRGMDETSPASLEAARLVAIEMAVVGRTRAEVDAHLRDSFRIAETTALLDDVFGGGGDATRTSGEGS